MDASSSGNAQRKHLKASSSKSARKTNAFMLFSCFCSKQPRKNCSGSGRVERTQKSHSPFLLNCIFKCQLHFHPLLHFIHCPFPPIRPAFFILPASGIAINSPIHFAWLAAKSVSPALPLVLPQLFSVAPQLCPLRVPPLQCHCPLFLRSLFKLHSPIDTRLSVDLAIDL